MLPLNNKFNTLISLFLKKSATKLTTREQTGKLKYCSFLKYYIEKRRQFKLRYQIAGTI